MKTDKYEVVAGWGDGCRNTVGKYPTKASAIKAAKTFARQEPSVEYRVWTIDEEQPKNVCAFGNVNGGDAR
jgi:hypothetical protein